MLKRMLIRGRTFASVKAALLGLVGLSVTWRSWNGKPIGPPQKSSTRIITAGGQRSMPFATGWRLVTSVGHGILPGIYYLGRITGPWAYIATVDHRRADVVNIRQCEWIKVGPVDAVPGKVLGSLSRASRTVQAVDDETVRIFSAYYYNGHTISAFRYELPAVSPDIFSLLSSEDCEDLVALYAVGRLSAAAQHM